MAIFRLVVQPKKVETSEQDGPMGLRLKIWKLPELKLLETCCGEPFSLHNGHHLYQNRCDYLQEIGYVDS